MALPDTLDREELVDAIISGEADVDTLDELTKAIWRWGRNLQPVMVCDLYEAGAFDFLGGLDRRWLPFLVADAWNGVEWPMRALDRDTWRELWTAAGYSIDGRRRARPRRPARLYRGAPVEHRDGWSWTPDPAVAQWFANRFPSLDARVWVADVEPARMLAKIRTLRAGENEVVVDTDGLTIRPGGLG